MRECWNQRGERKAKRIVILQPRRVAARMVATRMAWERGCRLGGEVGYQVRFEEHLSDASRLCFVTEGTRSPTFRRKARGSREGS